MYKCTYRGATNYTQMFMPGQNQKKMLQRNIFETPVSIYIAEPYFDAEGNFGTRFKPKSFVRPLHKFITAGELYADKIAEARRTLAEALNAWNRGDHDEYHRLLKQQYQFIKWSSPLACLQGVNPTHKNDGFTSYSDIICLDIDTEKPHKAPNGNEWVQSWPDLRDEIAENPFVAYCGLSVGGRGLFVLVPIKSHEHHAGHWRALCSLFRKVYGVTIDPATENIGRLRFMSYDPDARMNTQAAVFELVEEEPQRPQKLSVAASTYAGGVFTHDEEFKRFVAIVDVLVQRGIDITQSHDEWKKAAAGIAHKFGEAGRPHFHRIASQYPDYNERENDRLYTNMMRSYSGTTADIATFYYLCKQHGVEVGGGHRHTLAIPAPAPRRTSTAIEVQRPAASSPPAMPSAPLAPAASPAPSSRMSTAERADLERHRPAIAEGRAMLADMEQKNPAFKDMQQRFGLELCGVDGWMMTAAQFDEMMSEHPTPPF